MVGAGRGHLTSHRLYGTDLWRGMIRRRDIVDLPFSLVGDIFQPVTGYSPRIEIKYCTQCRWLLRAAWMAQELLTTFQDEVGEVTLVPGTGGVFEVRVGDEVIWWRAEQGRFPDIKELKQLVRDRIAPARDLGHSENKRE
jgi:selenoprotein W-related protein